MIFPFTKHVPLVTIHPFSLEAALGPLSYNLARLNNQANTAWPAANRAIYYPFTLASTVLVKQLWCFNGSVLSGAVDLGIYSGGGTRIISTASTAQAGASAIQAFNITDTQLGPGLYYMAMAMDNNTGRTQNVTIGTASRLQATGYAQQASAFSLPTLATFAATGTDYAPLFGLSTNSVI